MSILAMALISVALAIVGSQPVDADLADELEQLREQQAQVQADKEAQAAEVDAATAEAGELSAALEVLNAEVNEQQAKVSAAEQRLAAALVRQDEATEAVIDSQAAITGLEEQLSDRAISSFVTQNDPASPILEDADPTSAVRMRSLVASVNGDDVALTEELRRAKEDLVIEQAEAAAAAEEADVIRAQLIDDLAELERRQNAQAELVAGAEARLEQALAEAAALSELDTELAQQIVDTNEELARQAALARTRNPAPAPTSGGGGGGGGSFPTADQIVNVRGIWVHVDIADNLDRMLAAAEADGHSFSGGGYRDHQSQIRLRRAHCGSSDYAIWRMPASQCRPPTARPGASMHEQGKAIDFRYNGSIIGSRNNAGYRWLAAHAAEYGFYNLPSEPWHWSINGR